jgi:nucleoside-diphosphate-sugar epimerase
MITGGGGFIGCRLAHGLARTGYRVRGLDLQGSAANAYRDLGGELMIGDMLKGDDLARACQGADLVVHTAARMGIDDDWGGFRAVNVEGAERVARTAREAGAKAFVHLSSVMVYGFDYPDGVREDGPLDGAKNPYCQTKIESEAAVLRHHAPGSFDVYVIRPGDVYGPGCQPWVRTPVELMKAGRWVNLDHPPAIHNHVYVDNLVDGILLVLAARRAGEPFTITDGARTPTREFFGRYERLLGVSPPVLPEKVLLDLKVPPVWIQYLKRSAADSVEKIRGLGYLPRVGLD